MQQHDSADDWWHERATKPVDLRTSFHTPLTLQPRHRPSIWPKAVIVVGLMFALVLALASMVAR